MDVSNSSIGKHDSELDGVVSSLAHCALDVFDNPVAILWMDPLQYRFTVRKALLRIEAPNSEIFLGPIESRYRVEGPAPCMRKPLRFRQVTLAPAQRLFRPLALGGGHCRSDELDLTERIARGARDDMDVLDGAVGHHQAIFMLEILSILRRALDGLLHEGRVLRMDTLQDALHGRFRGSVVLEDPEGLLRPDDLASGNLPAEAARTTQLLRFRQVRLLALLGALARDANAGGVLQDGRAHERVLVILRSHWRAPISSAAIAVPRTRAWILAEAVFRPCEGSSKKGEQTPSSRVAHCPL